MSSFNTDDFSIFETVFNEYDQEITKPQTIPNNDEDCNHNNTITENGMVVCNDCGREFKRKIENDKEWRYFSATDGKKSSSDPNRVQARRIDDKSIFKDVEGMGFSEKIISKANSIYMDISQGQIFRGKPRKAIIFACIFHSHKFYGNPQTPDELIKLFQITRKSALKGINTVNMHSAKNPDIYNTDTCLRVLIFEIMDKFKANETQKQEVINLYNKIKNKSSDLNRARPKSVSASLIYYWMKSKNIDITIKEFSDIAELSELTIKKIVKEIENVNNIQ